MSLRSRLKTFVGVSLLALCATYAFAQLPNPYGMSIGGETAKKAAAAALAEARKNNWTMAAAIVDTAGDLVYFEKLDGTQAASTLIAVDKARSAVRFKRPTKALQDVLAAGGEASACSRFKAPCRLKAVCRSSWTGRSSGRSACREEPARRTVSARRPAPIP